MPAGRTHYQVLGLEPGASPAEVKSAYRRAARDSHPDRGGDAEEFRAVVAAYQVLSDPAERVEYDRSLMARATGEPAGPTTQAGPRRRPGSAATDPVRFVPADPALWERLLPPEVVTRQVHGQPLPRGLFEGGARLARETRTAGLLANQVVRVLPAARLVNGLRLPGGQKIAHAVLAGYRLAVIDSLIVPAGVYFWDGMVLRHGKRAIRPPDLSGAVRAAQEIFFETNVSGWVAVSTPAGITQEPVIDHARRGDPATTASLQVVNGMNLVRDLKLFLASGPQPNVVEVELLARLLQFAER